MWSLLNQLLFRWILIAATQAVGVVQSPPHSIFPAKHKPLLSSEGDHYPNVPMIMITWVYFWIPCFISLIARPGLYRNVVNHKDGLSNHLGKEGGSNKFYWDNWITIWKKIKLYPYLIPCTRINSKLMEDLNGKKERKKKKPRKLIEENIGKIFLNPSTGFPYFCK